MNHDASNAPGCVQPHVCPGLALVDGLVDSVARHVDVADGPRFTRSRPDHFVIGRSHGQRSDGGHGLVVEDRIPCRAAVGGFPNAARCGSHVVGGWIARNASCG